MSLEEHILQRLRRRALAEIRVSHGFRVRQSLTHDPHTRRSWIHLSNCANLNTLIAAIRNRQSKQP